MIWWGTDTGDYLLTIGGKTIDSKSRMIIEYRKVLLKTVTKKSKVGEWMKADDVIRNVTKLCRNFGAKKIILYGSRAKGTARERSDIDIAVSGVKNFDDLAEQVEELPTLYSVDLLDMDRCRNHLLLEDIRQYGREI